MDLKEFVVTTLTSIIEGVREVQNKYPRGKGGDVFVNPQMLMEQLPSLPGHTSIKQLNRENLTTAGMLATNENAGFADIIEFDVALTVEAQGTVGEETTTGGGGELKVYVLSADAKVQSKDTKEAKNTESNVSRIKFRVPVQFPRAH